MANLERFVVLENLLDTTSDVVVFLADNVGVHDTRSGVERVDSRVDGQLGNTTRQHSGGVQVSECGGWGGICKIISWHVDGLHRGNGTLFGGGNSLLKGTQISGEGGLITDSRWDTTEQGGHF